MELQVSISEIVANAARLEKRDFDQLFNKLNLLRAQRSAPSLAKNEANLLKKINDGFSQKNWARLIFLDHKMEFSDLTEAEAEESLGLVEMLENYTVERLVSLKKLAAIRKITVEQLMVDLEIAPQ